MTKRIAAIFLLLTLLLAQVVPVQAAETEAPAADPVPITTVEELLAISEDPYGSYILMEDLDLAGVAWKSMDFYGVFDGNGHAILNVTITQPGDEICDAYDGNLKPYPCNYFGFFGVLRDAQVKNLKLINVRALVEWDGPVFMGTLAGYGDNAVITDCSVTGTLELRAQDRCFGLAGLVGYGMGRMENCNVDVTLICVDTDDTTRDEQFLGGLFATSYFLVYNCNVKLDAYISEHGYVHSGGITGMHTWYPWTDGSAGYIVDTHISGKITFFEDNHDRRAYCEPLIGEPLPGWIVTEGSTSDFLRDEKFTYDRELRPEMCEQPSYLETVTAPGCDSYGFTTYTCQECGYTYTDRYTLFSHDVTEWTLTKAPTVEEEGISTGYCACGMEHTRTEPKLEPEPTTVPTTQMPTEAPTEPVQELVPVERDGLFYILMGAAIALAVLAVVLIYRLIRSGKRR